jgi:hypothetical protein
MIRRTLLRLIGAIGFTALPSLANAKSGVTPLVFNTGIPIVKDGSLRSFIVMTRGKTKEHVFAAYYLNRYPLEYDPDCVCKNEDDHEDGCPTTGWFYDNSNFEYDNCYHALEGEVIAWAELPTPGTVKAALA